jgi:hypothetical protein
VEDDEGDDEDDDEDENQIDDDSHMNLHESRDEREYR